MTIPKITQAHIQATTIAPHEGLVVEYSKFSECMKITGIAKGYVLEGAV